MLATAQTRNGRTTSTRPYEGSVYALRVALPPGLARKSRFGAPTRGRIGACGAHVHGWTNWRRTPQHVALARPAPPRTVRSSLRHSVYAGSVLGDPAALAKPLPSMSPECADGRRRESGAGKWWPSTRLAGRRGSPGAAWPAVVDDTAACVDPQAVGWGSAVDLAAAPTPVCR